MIAQGKKSSIKWVAAALIAVLLAGCASLPTKNTSVRGQSTNSQASSSKASSKGSGASQDTSGANSGIHYPVIDQSTLASSSKIILNKQVKTNLFTLSVPASWTVTNDGNTSAAPLSPYLLFNKIDDNIYGGGAVVQEWNAQPGENTSNLAMLLMWLLPNHAEITETDQITGFFTDAYLMKVDQGKPAASGDTSITHWTYIIFVDKNKTTATKFVAYDLFFNTDFASEADAVKIAGNFKLV